MQKSKAILSALALATAAFMSPAAHAVDISHPTTAIEVVDNTAFFGALFDGNNRGNTFADKYTFTTTGEGGFFADLVSISGTARNGLDITGFSLFDDSGEILAGTMLQNGRIDSWSLSADTLAAGSYYVQVQGTVLSQAAGKYYANVALAPVPEPETYAMMLAGLGLLGVTARRRSKKQAEAAQAA